MVRYALFSVLCVVLVAATGGCTAPQHRTGQPNLARLVQSSWEDQYAKSLEFKYGKDNFSTILGQYDSAPSDDGRTKMRNTIITELMWLSNYSYQQDVDALLTGDNSVNFIGDVITLGLTSAATIAGGTEAKTILSGVATVVTGVKTAYDADYLHKQTITAIINQMNSSRADAKAALVAGLARKDSDYPLRTGALPDFEKYDQSGSIAQAIVTLEQNSSTAAQKSQENLKNVTNKVNGVTPALTQPAEQPTTPPPTRPS